MPPSIKLRDVAQEASLLRARIVIASVLVVCLSLILVVRMVQLQVVDYDHFRALSHNNRVKIVPVAPTRGLIFDRNGVVLAQNTPTYSLEVVPEAVQDMDATLAALKRIVDIRDVDEARFRRLLQTERDFEYIPLRTRLSEDEVARFAVNRYRFPGVEINARLARDYPLGPLAAHLVGYVGRINKRELQEVDPANYRGTDHIGKTGVEQAYEEVLHGKVGYQHVETNAQGRTLRVLERKPPEPGKDLYLTIDASLQAVAEAALGEENGAVVAIEPGTGSVLAFASMPTFDPNEFVDGIDADTYHRLLSSPDRPLFNRALHGRYPPGSTIKPFLALGALERDVEKLQQEIFCPGYYRLKGRARKYRDWKKWGHGRVDMTQAIAQSCDVYFYQLAMAFGIDRMHDFLAEFGFGEPTGIDLEGESTGINPSSEWKRRARNQPWFPGETLIAGIGQGYTLVTPLQLASATAALAARGIRFAPRVVQRMEDPVSGESSVVPFTPLPPVQREDPAHWESIVHAMVEVVHGPHGTARRVGRDASYRIAGKTGTAQVIGVAQDEEYDKDTVKKKLRDHALFIAFAPAANPRIAVAVVVENGGSGSGAAAPVARTVLDHYLLEGSDDKPGDGMLLTASGAEGAQR